MNAIPYSGGTAGAPVKSKSAFVKSKPPAGVGARYHSMRVPRPNQPSWWMYPPVGSMGEGGGWSPHWLSIPPER